MSDQTRLSGADLADVKLEVCLPVVLYLAAKSSATLSSLAIGTGVEGDQQARDGSFGHFARPVEGLLRHEAAKAQAGDKRNRLVMAVRNGGA